MVTVKDANMGFEEKGLQISLPYPQDWKVKQIDLLEKIRETSKVRVLLAVTVITDTNQEVCDLLYAESNVKREDAPKTIRVEKEYKTQLLPSRDRVDFSDEPEASSYLSKAFEHLLIDRGYEISSEPTADLLGWKGKKLFFCMVGIRCDDRALEKARKLIQVRKEKGGDHDYGLVMVAFQSSLGISLLNQDRWISQYQSYFSNHRIGIYAVDNRDPNMIYPFSVYPKEKDLFVYFVKTSRLWRTVKDRYVIGRIKGPSNS